MFPGRRLPELRDVYGRSLTMKSVTGQPSCGAKHSGDRVMQLHPRRLRLRGDFVSARRRSAWTYSASCGAVRRHALLSRRLAPRDEFVGHMITAPEVHLVGCLPLKRVVRHHSTSLALTQV